MHINSMLLFKKYAKKCFGPNITVLEIGPDKFPSSYCEIVSTKSIDWQTLDLYSDVNLTYIAKDEYTFPVNDNTFDIVLSGQVLEHVRKPWVWIKELARICKVGGYVITISPVSWPYHQAPIDCWRTYPDGMKALYEEGGIKVELCKMESLERSDLRRIYPGEGAMPERNLKSIIKKLTGWPFTYAIDTITIGMK